MKHLFFVAILLNSLVLSAQKILDYRYTETPLKLVVQDIEERNQLSFSFAEDLVQNITITYTSEAVELVELLGVLEAQSGLIFEWVTNTQLTISPRKPSGGVCGYLLDADTRTPIAFSTLVVNDTIETTTNAKGFFSLENQDLDALNFKVFGYGSFSLAEGDGCRSLYLNPVIEALKEVVVTGYITSGIDKKKDGSVQVTQKSLGILPGLISPDILQSVQLVPGVTSLDESAAGLQIRGGTADQNLIRFDGIKLFNTGYFYGMFSRFNPSATERATIFKSGTSAAYGDRISGIVDISSSNEIPDGMKVGLGVDGLSTDGFLKAPLNEKLAVNVFFRSSYTGLFQTAAYNGYARKIFRNGGVVRDANGNELNIVTDDEFDFDSSTNDFSFYDINAKVIYKPSDRSQLTLSTLFTRNALDFSFTRMGEARLDSLVTKNNGMSLNWQHQTSEKQRETINAYFSRYDSFYQNLEVLVPDDILEEVNIRSNEINDFGVDIATHRTVNKKHFYSLGYQISNTNNRIEQLKEEPFEPESNFSDPADESNLKNAAFVEYQYNMSNTGILGGGLRAVHYNSVGRAFLEPRLNIEYPMGAYFRAKASAERRNQPISQLVEFNQTELRLENNLWRLSDEVTYPLLQSNQVSAGVLFDNKGWTLDVDGYYKRISGLTSFTNGFSTPQLALSEGKSTILGLDVLLKKRIGNYRFWAGYSFNDISFNFPEIQEGNFPGNNDITHNFRISNSLTLNRLRLSLGWQYRTGEPFTPILNFDENSTNVQFGSINSDRLPDFHRLDASAVYSISLNKVKNQYLQLGVSALNMYDRKIPLSITYRAEENGDNLQLEQVVQRFSLGFTPNFTLRVFF